MRDLIYANPSAGLFSQIYGRALRDPFVIADTCKIWIDELVAYPTTYLIPRKFNDQFIVIVKEVRDWHDRHRTPLVARQWQEPYRVITLDSLSALNEEWRSSFY